MKTEKILVILSISILVAMGIFYYLVEAEIIRIKPTAEEGTLSLSPTAGSYDVDETFTVDIVLDTAGVEVDGMDIFYLNYSPSLLAVQDADNGTPGVQISQGDIFDIYIGNSVDTDSGQISLSGIVTPGGTPYNGSGIVATITFRALAEGVSTVNFDFTPGATNDCNIAEHATGNDILGNVVNGAYTLGEPPSPSQVDIKGDNQDGPMTVDYGTEVILSWNASDADTCTASGDWSGDKPTSGSQSTGELTSSKTYTLTCTGAGGSGEDSVIVNVTPLDQPPEEPGETPRIIDRIIEGIKAAPTGAALSIGLIIVVILLAIASLIYLKRNKPQEESSTDNK